MSCCGAARSSAACPPASGLVSRMTGDERFVRPTSKGFYALREDYPEVTQSVGARRRKRKV